MPRNGNSEKVFLAHRFPVNWLVAFALAVSAIGGPAAEAQRIPAGYSIYSALTAPLWVTKEAGHFKKNGLDVDLIFLSGGTMAAQALTSGDIPFTLTGGSAIISSNLAGSGSMILLGIENAILFKLVSAKDIKSPEQLRGKRLAVASLSGSTYQATVLALAHFGIKPNEVTFISIASAPTRLAAINSGSVQGTVVLSPDTIVARRMGMNFLLDMGTLDIEFQNAGIAAGRQVLENKPEIVRQFVKSMVEGIHTYKTDKAFSIKVLRKYLKTDDPELVQEGYSFYADKLPKKPYPTLKGIQAILDQLAKTNPKAAGGNPGQFVDVQYLRELDTSGYIDRLYTKP
jgi:ABC-type nitrate/sulfonate/bicarbonate transport system substrate-binding protein